MSGITFEQAVDDYLRQIVRTRPWTMLDEEELLIPFSTWLSEQPDLSSDLSTVTPAITGRYALVAGLSDDAWSELDSVLWRLLVWAEVLGYATADPFARLAVE